MSSSAIQKEKRFKLCAHSREKVRYDMEKISG
jgi:hypothetical protein